MQDAIEEFHGTTEEGRVTIANASLALYRGDTKLVLQFLKSIGRSQTHCNELSGEGAGAVLPPSLVQIDYIEINAATINRGFQFKYKFSSPTGFRTLGTFTRQGFQNKYKFLFTLLALIQTSE
jgi:hypothetical protein